jgi:hypothetical protein
MNPSEKSFTYRANANGQHIQSRLDRIYTNLATSELTYDWKTTPSAVPTDHWMVAVKYSPHDAPYIGRGRWTWPLDTLKNNKLINTIIDRGIQLQDDFNELERDQPDQTITNRQLLWKTFKEDIKNSAKKHT